jgi:hypothetical protein
MNFLKIFTKTFLSSPVNTLSVANPTGSAAVINIVTNRNEETPKAISNHCGNNLHHPFCKRSHANKGKKLANQFSNVCLISSLPKQTALTP